MQRDMTEKQFQEACKRRGFGRIGFLGYVTLASPAVGSVSVLNANSTRRRTVLAYLIRQQVRAEKRLDT